MRVLIGHDLFALRLGGEMMIPRIRDYISLRYRNESGQVSVYALGTVFIIIILLHTCMYI